jgi:hypothetical protein
LLRCIAVLVPVVIKEPPPTLQLAISLQSRLVGRFSQLQLLAILPQLLPPLFEVRRRRCRTELASVTPHGRALWSSPQLQMLAILPQLLSPLFEVRIHA